MPMTFRLSEFLPYQLAYISERVSHRLSKDYKKSHGISVAEWRVLANLHFLGTASVKDIQTFTNLEKSRVSRAVGRLETSGLVEKRVSSDDARLVEIALTSLGSQTFHEILPEATQVEGALLSGLSEKQLRAFFDVVEHFHRVLDEDPIASPRFETARSAKSSSET